MTCKNNCQFHPDRKGKRARYSIGWWCKVCEASFVVGPRCPCCHQGMRAASRHPPDQPQKLRMRALQQQLTV